MTDEELKKEAEEYYFDRLDPNAIETQTIESEFKRTTRLLRSGTENHSWRGNET